MPRVKTERGGMLYDSSQARWAGKIEALSRPLVKQKVMPERMKWLWMCGGVDRRVEKCLWVLLVLRPWSSPKWNTAIRMGTMKDAMLASEDGWSECDETDHLEVALLNEKTGCCWFKRSHYLLETSGMALMRNGGFFVTETSQSVDAKRVVFSGNAWHSLRLKRRPFPLRNFSCCWWESRRLIGEHRRYWRGNNSFSGENLRSLYWKGVVQSENSHGVNEKQVFFKRGVFNLETPLEFGEMAALSPLNTNLFAECPHLMFIANGTLSHAFW